MKLARPLVVALALLAGSPLTMAAHVHASDLQCSFRAQAEPTGRVALKFTLRNTSELDLHLLRWGSPFEAAWSAPFVRVRTAKAELPFEGAMRKRGDPAAQDYLRLPAGQSLEATVMLDDAFTLPPSGPLMLQAAWRWHDAMAGGQPPRPREQHQGLDQDCGQFTLQR